MYGLNPVQIVTFERPERCVPSISPWCILDPITKAPQFHHLRDQLHLLPSRLSFYRKGRDPQRNEISVVVFQMFGSL